MYSLLLYKFSLAFFFLLADAHYNLIYPHPYNVIHCSLPFCAYPCPPVWSSGDAKAPNSPETTNVIWKRGQIVNIVYHKNNHLGGFFRRSLVPVKHMFDHNWHTRTAFEWGCWSQGQFLCKNGFPSNPAHSSNLKLKALRECGTDTKGRAYSSNMIVPNVFPDGDYVFSQLWFGGIRTLPNSLKKVMFHDFHTCAFVKIQGGQPLVHQYTPKFNVGIRPKYSKKPPNKCWTFGIIAKQCGGNSCRHATHRWAVPKLFENGSNPPDVTLDDLNDDDPEWMESEKEAREDRAESGWNDRHTICSAAFKSCSKSTGNLKVRLCLGCVKWKCAVPGCAWCAAYRWNCQRSLVGKKINKQWSDSMRSCASLHHSCINERKPYWLRRGACFLCSSRIGCGRVNCFGQSWCSLNASKCRQVRF